MSGGMGISDVVDVRGYGNLCPSDCGNRSLTGHADSAVCNQWQLVCVQHFTMSDNSGSITCHFGHTVSVLLLNVEVCKCAYLKQCSVVDVRLWLCAFVDMSCCGFVLLWMCAFVDVWMCVHVRF